MGGRQAEPRTRFARVACSDPGTTVLRISGSLGPGAKPYLSRLTQECRRRNLPRLVLDLSEVDALGGGTARLLNEFAAERGGRGGKTAFRVTSRTVRGFLGADPTLPPPYLAATLEEALAAVRGDESALFLDEPPPPPQLRPASRRGEPGLGAPRLAALPGPEPCRPIALDIDADLDIDLDAILDEPEPAVWALAGQGAERAERRRRLLAALQASGVAPRVFLFELQPDDTYCLVTRQGIDRDRMLPAGGALPRAIQAMDAPGFVVDLAGGALDDAESELLSQLNCEVAAAVWNGERAEHLVFISKARPGDEYSLDELQEFERVLCRAGEDEPRPSRSLDEGSARQPVRRAAPGGEPKPRGGSPVGREEAAPGDAIPRRRAVAPPSPVMPLPRVAAPPSPVMPPPRVAGLSSPAMPPPRAAAEDPDIVHLRRRLAQMRDILSLSQDFDATFGTARILEVLVLSVVSVARVESALYFAARESEYRLTHHRGMSPEAVRGLRLYADSSLVQAALASPRGLALATATQVTEEERIWARQHGLQLALPFRFKAETHGILLLGSSAADAPPDLDMLSFLLGQAGLAYDRACLYETLQDRTLGVVRGLIMLIEGRNGYDCGSTEQVVRYVQALSRELQYPHEATRDLVYGAVLRDVGMLKLSEALLRSAQDLTADEWEAIRRHPVEGAAIMRQMRFSDVAADVVLHHHEAYNGEGYPMGLRGRAIPMGARIVAVAESYVKMTMDRPYRKALGKAEALESLAENWGLRYDPLVVDALVRVVNRELSMGLQGDRDLTRDLFGV